MRSLSEIADNYDECARVYDAMAEMILAGLAPLSGALRGKQCERAGWLSTEAAALRAKAAELRKAEAVMLQRIEWS